MRDVDLLFVIDDTSTMVGKQTALAGALGTYIQTLQSMKGGLPNLHIGVVSASVAGASECTGDGQLVAASGCGVDGNFLSDVAGPDGTRARNYSGSLDEAFVCMAQLAPSGCPFAQPMEAMKRALDGHLQGNAGFQRPDTFLQIVLVSAQDDCSASDDALFDPATAGLGPVSPFRCTQAGITCDGATVGTKSKDYQSCQPIDPSPYLRSVGTYVDFLKGVSQDPEIVAVSTVAGDPSPFSVEVDGGTPTLEPSCTAGLGPALPAVRLNALTERLGRGRFVSACEARPETALTQIDSFIRSGTQEPCLAGALALDSSSRPRCTVVDDVTAADGSKHQATIPACKTLANGDVDPESDAPCWYSFTSTESCPDTQTHIGVSVFRTAVTSDSIKTSATCSLE